MLLLPAVCPCVNHYFDVLQGSGFFILMLFSRRGKFLSRMKNGAVVLDKPRSSLNLKIRSPVNLLRHSEHKSNDRSLSLSPGITFVKHFLRLTYPEAKSVSRLLLYILNGGVLLFCTRVQLPWRSWNVLIVGIGGTPVLAIPAAALLWVDGLKDSWEITCTFFNFLHTINFMWGCRAEVSYACFSLDGQILALPNV